MSGFDSRLRIAARELAQLLSKNGDQKVVFAESCTAGLVSAALATVPGISQYHCGSAVTYRVQTKSDWLTIGKDLETVGSVADSLTREMAMNVLGKTAEATWSAAITGHLGPGAPDELDGVIFLATAKREGIVPVVTHHLQISLNSTSREDRMSEAAALVLEQLHEQMST